MKTDNLFDKEALEKLQSMAEGIKVAMLLTNLKTHPINANPMTTKKGR
jgi:general stress protein 26